MNKDNVKDFLPLVQALADGKVIQLLDINGNWGDIDELKFMSNPSMYRIKPEPREFWVSLEQNGRVYDCKPSNETVCKMGLGTIIKVREILD